ncbi:hypothetical protein ABIC65_001357 [Sphingomonas trueperi]
MSITAQNARNGASAITALTSAMNAARRAESFLKESERRLLLADFALVQNRGVMTEVFELQPPKGWLNIFRICALFEYTKNQSKNGKLRINRLKTVISTFVRKDDVVAKCRHSTNLKLVDGECNNAVWQ